jgi:hypothetical protein
MAERSSVSKFKDELLMGFRDIIAIVTGNRAEGFWLGILCELVGFSGLSTLATRRSDAT